jgi:WD40 repeat protein
MAVSVGYDKKVIVWSFGDGAAKGGGARARAKSSAVTPSMVLGGHGAPVLDCTFLNDRLVSGSKDGAVFMWDVTTGNVLAK